MDFEVALPGGKTVRVFDQRIYGLWDSHERTIAVDDRQTEEERLNTLIHEALHALAPQWGEQRVSDNADFVAAILWKAGYRRRK